MPTSKRTKHGSGKVYHQKPPKYDPQYFHDLRDSLRSKLKDSLTLAELAEWLDNNTYRFPIYKDWLEWLKQEATDADN